MKALSINSFQEDQWLPLDIQLDDTRSANPEILMKKLADLQLSFLVFERNSGDT